MENLHKGCKDQALQAVRAEAEGFDDKDIAVLVHRDAGQKVRLAEDHAAG